MAAPLTLKVHLTPGFPLVDDSGRYEGWSHWSPSTTTLIYGETSALLVDVPFIASQVETLADWIEAQIPGRSLTEIYITHGHGDHFLGLPIILKRFPGAKVFAVPSVYEDMRAQADPKTLAQTYNLAFKGELALEGLQKAVEDVIELKSTEDRDNEGMQIDGHEIKIVEVGQSDCAHSTFVWVPSLKAVVAGDIVYNQVHQQLREANTKAKRDEWIKSVETIEALEPEIVVAGHKKEGQGDGPHCCRETIRYIERFEELVEKSAGWEDFFEEMLLEYPDRDNRAVLRTGAKLQF
jgi:glyoxylase-like metal-dependent hydrolase (beta-lactamase superfamily II)